MSGHPASRLPDAIGRYRILKELGRGMMGLVYLAQDPALDRLIALKTIDLAFAVPETGRAGFEQRFLAEARVAARLQHPAIVVVHDVGRDDARGILYIALEYLHGRTLAETVADGRPMPWREALRIVAALARGLHHAHAQGIVHRDVKPANVMILPSGQPKIMDFGIAKVPHLELTSAGQFFGTPLYMSPEQAAGGAVDGRSDLFSLGSLAYHLLTGRQAFWSENVLQILSRVVNETPPPPSSLVPELPAAVDRVVSRAMAKDPAARHPTGEDMASDIEALLASRATEPGDDLPLLELVADAPEAVADGTRPTIPLPRVADPQRPPAEPLPAASHARGAAPKNRWRPALIGAAAVLLPVALAVVATRPRRPAEPRDAARASAAPVPRGRDARPVEAPEPRREERRAVAASEDGRLEVDFEHHLRGGRIQVWVDDDEVLDEQFDSRVARRILSLRLRKGEVQQVVTVPPGRHQVRVRLQWSGNVKSRRITGAFAAGETRTLRVRVSRIFNELSLSWNP
jgi:serine/threonine-protein kinase